MFLCRTGRDALFFRIFEKIIMSLYKTLTRIGSRYVGLDKLFLHGFNLSPMYRRSTARVQQISKDLMHITVRLPISYKNRNYMNSIFGGSMFSAVDPIPMIQLVNLLGDRYVVWDKSAEILFKRPAKVDLYAHFNCTAAEISEIKQRILTEKEIEITKTTLLTDKEGVKTYCEVRKTIYIADKDHYKNKQAARKQLSEKNSM